MANLSLEVAENLASVYSYEVGYYTNDRTETVTYNGVWYSLTKVYCPKSIKMRNFISKPSSIAVDSYVGPVVRVVIKNEHQTLNLAITPDGDICGIRLCRFCDLGMIAGDFSVKCANCRKTGNNQKKSLVAIQMPGIKRLPAKQS
jgi:hypothetical protein